MENKSWMILRLLLNRYHTGNVEALLRGLPEGDSQKVLNQNIESKNVKATLFQPAENLKIIHYSWLIPKLQNLSKDKLFLVLSLLPEPQGSKLRDHFSELTEPPHLSPPMKSFLFQQLYSELQLNQIMPLEYLPESELTPLVKLKKNEIIELIDFLGLHDLAEEIHHIVDKKILENIYSCLTKKKQAYIRQCFHRKDKLVTQRLQLENWDGDCQKLMKLLHHRGMVRLGYALSGQHPDLLWYITHILDTGRGEKLSRYYHKEGIPGVTASLKKQILKVINFFKK